MSSAGIYKMMMTMVKFPVRRGSHSGIRFKPLLPSTSTTICMEKVSYYSSSSSMTNNTSHSLPNNNNDDYKENKSNNRNNNNNSRGYFVGFASIAALAYLSFLKDKDKEDIDIDRKNMLTSLFQFPRVEAAKPFVNTDSGYVVDQRNPSQQQSGLPLGNQEKSKTEFKKTAAGVDAGQDRANRFNFIADVVDLVASAVVSIEVKDHTSLDWFSGSHRTTSNGSGFIISEDGLILTNAHVIAGLHKSSFSVRLADGRVFSGKVEDLDTHSDLALLKISAKKLPTIPLGDSSKVRPGEFAVALGSPLTLSNTVTAGIISSVSRNSSELGIGNNISYIQTDASITFGNSGGPLVNLNGHVIGINSMKVAPGISFAIPINYAKEFLRNAEIRKKAGKTKPVRRYIGVTTITLSEDLYDEMFRRGSAPEVDEGVIVLKVVVGSPAYLSGLQPGDIITKINNKKILTVADIYQAVDKYEILKTVVIRGHKTYEFTISPENVYLS